MYPYVKLEQGTDLVLEKNGAFNAALQDWTNKWVPIISEYSISLSRKKATLATQIRKDSEGCSSTPYLETLYNIYIYILQENHVMTTKLFWSCFACCFKTKVHRIQWFTSMKNMRWDNYEDSTLLTWYQKYTGQDNQKGMRKTIFGLESNPGIMTSKPAHRHWATITRQKFVPSFPLMTAVVIA